MKKILSIIVLAAALVPAARLRAVEAALTGSDGLHLGTASTDRVGLYGVTPVVRPSGSSQAALTDSTTGTAGTTLAAGAGVFTLSVPVDLPSVADGDILVAFTPGYKFKVLSATFAVTKPVTTGAKATTITAKIGSNAITGFSVALTSANCTPIGALVASSAITAANTGAANATFTLTAGSTTAFAEGQGVLLITVQNMDTADAVASIARLQNAIRTGLVNTGVIAGQ